MESARDLNQQPDSDEELMRRVQLSDEDAFAQLMQRWERPVKAVIARLVFNTTDAEELAQEAFVRLWQKRDRFEPGRTFKPWLMGIAVNLAHNRLRWWKRRPVISLDDWLELPDTASDPVDTGKLRLEQKEVADAVRHAIAKLPADYREALVLFEYEEMSYQDIAEALCVNAKTVENRIARARARLRPVLAQWRS